ncbi:MAG: glycosyltransferase family 39 protein [Bacteroidales bacterium]|nr:glycosyltransferase family 39 protein [Bacteroidales bacterium]
MQLLKIKSDLIIYCAGFILVAVYILLFKPVSDTGDAPTYLLYANSIIEGEDSESLINRSPFYPWILALLILIFGNVCAIKLAVIIQFLLFYCSGIIVYKILMNNIYNKIAPAICTTFIILLSLSGIFYCYMLITEAMTLFFLTTAIWFIIKGYKRLSGIDFFISGVLVSIMVLTRFNTLPMILVFTLIIILIQLNESGERPFIKIRNVIIFLIPIILILDGFAFFNYSKYDFYGLFPSGGSVLVSRNALIKTIDGTEKISTENLHILKIFKEAGGKIKVDYPEKKGSLIRFDKMQIIDNLYGGFSIYSEAKPELCNYFAINPEKPEPELSAALAPFYKEIRIINRRKVWKLRLFSLLNSFRSSSGIVLFEKPDINLGLLPGWFIKLYKIVFFVLTVFVFISSILYLILLIFKYIRPNMIIVMFIFTVFGFFFINFAFATAGDANRYKYPADPLIIALGVYYVYSACLYLKSKIGLKYKFQVSGFRFSVSGYRM